MNINLINKNKIKFFLSLFFGITNCFKFKFFKFNKPFFDYRYETSLDKGFFSLTFLSQLLELSKEKKSLEGEKSFLKKLADGSDFASTVGTRRLLSIKGATGEITKRGLNLFHYKSLTENIIN